MDLIGIAKSIDSGQPAQSAQADHGRNFLLLADFLTLLNCHFEINEFYRPVLTSFLFYHFY